VEMKTGLAMTSSKMTMLGDSLLRMQRLYD
jgi:hypothetical protein